jgi:hypothetical protein
MEASMLAAKDTASFAGTGIAFGREFMVMIRNVGKENATVKGSISVVSSSASTVMGNWVYFVAGAGGLVFLIIGGVLFKVFYSKYGQCAGQKLAAVKAKGITPLRSY